MNLGVSDSDQSECLIVINVLVSTRNFQNLRVRIVSTSAALRRGFGPRLELDNSVWLSK